MGQSQTAGATELPLFSRWMETTQWLLRVTEGFPKHRRWTLTRRIEELALDVLEGITQASYVKDKTELLRSCNLKLTRLRILLRLSHELGHLARQHYLRSAEELDECGRMLGGWLRSCGRDAASS